MNFTALNLQDRGACPIGSQSGLLVGAAFTQRPDLFQRGGEHGAAARHEAEPQAAGRRLLLVTVGSSPSERLWVNTREIH